MPTPKVDIVSVVHENGNPFGDPQIEKFRLQLMSLLGIKNAAGITEFMETPAGIESVNMVVEQVMLEETYQKQHEQERRDAQIRHNRALGFLLLALLYREADAKERLQESYDEYKKIIEQGNESAAEQAKQAVSQADQMYDDAMRELDRFIEQQNREAEELEQEQEALLKEQETLDEKYETIDEQINKGLDLIQQLPVNTDKETSTKSIKKEVFKLDNKIEALSDEIAKMSEEGKDVTDKLNKLNGYALRREMLENFQSKNFYTADGELIKPEEKQERYHEAAFFLKPELKLVKHNGQLMILRHDQDPKSLSSEKLAQAAKTFQAQKDQYSELSKLSAKTKSAEKESLSTRVTNLAERSERLSDRIMILTNQKSVLEEGKTQVNKLMQTQQSTSTAQKANGPVPQPKSSPQSYLHILKLMGAQKAPNPTKLMAITQVLSSTQHTDPEIKATLVQRLQDAKLIKSGDSIHKQLSSSGPIQSQTVRELQERTNQRPQTADSLQEHVDSHSPLPTTPKLR